VWQLETAAWRFLMICTATQLTGNIASGSQRYQYTAGPEVSQKLEGSAPPQVPMVVAPASARMFNK